MITLKKFLPGLIVSIFLFVIAGLVVRIIIQSRGAQFLAIFDEVVSLLLIAICVQTGLLSLIVLIVKRSKKIRILIVGAVTFLRRYGDEYADFLRSVGYEVILKNYVQETTEVKPDILLVLCTTDGQCDAFRLLKNPPYSIWMQLNSNIDSPVGVKVISGALGKRAMYDEIRALLIENTLYY